jgi:hypothetical protein
MYNIPFLGFVGFQSEKCFFVFQYGGLLYTKRFVREILPLICLIGRGIEIPAKMFSRAVSDWLRNLIGHAQTFFPPRVPN